VNFLLDQYNQAWSHYRHTESMRTQYLGFFFTVLLGSAAFALPILRSSDDSPEAAATGTLLFLVALQAMSYFACVSVIRMGSVLRHYHRAIDRLADALEEEGKIPSAMRGVMRTEGRLTVSRGRSVSGLAERLMRGSMVIVNLLAWATTIAWIASANHSGKFDGIRSWIVAVACLVGACVVTALAIRAFRTQPESVPVVVDTKTPAVAQRSSTHE
jgi:hypothetical protein